MNVVPQTPQEGLQELLHVLLRRLHDAVELVRAWPESPAPAVHSETTTKLIRGVQDIVRALQNVEEHVLQPRHAAFREQLQQCRIPHDLLDLLDHGPSSSGDAYTYGLNPECFMRGLVQLAQQQLAGLKRRKLALALLQNSVQGGLLKKQQQQQQQHSSQQHPSPPESSSASSTKRPAPLPDDDDTPTSPPPNPPPAKKQRRDA